MTGFLRAARSVLSDTSEIIFEHELSDRRTGIVEALLIIAVIALSFILHFRLLSASPFPPGSDGYIFLVQARSLLEGKGLHYHDPSLFYLILTPLTAVINPVTALKVSIAIISSLCTLSIFLLARSDGRSGVERGVAAAWCAFSPAMFFFCAQFPKQFLGITLFVFFIRSLRTRKTVIAILFLVCAVLSHRFSAALAILFIITYITRRIGKGKLIRMIVPLGAILLVIASVIATVPGTLSFRDIARLTPNDISLPVPPIVSFAHLIPGIHPLILLDAAISMSVIACAVFLLIIKKKRMSAWTVSLIISVIILSVPLFAFSNGGAGYRLYLATLPLSAALLAGTGLPVRKTGIAVIISISALGVAHASFDRFFRYDPPYDQYVKVAKKTGAMIPENTLLIVAHRPLAETAGYVLNIDTLAWRPEARFDRTRTYRIVRDIKKWEIARIVKTSNNDSRIYEISPFYLLVREDLWDVFLLKIPSDNDDLLTRATGTENPSSVRPEFITGR